jgi:HAE1 family hydrophobic/amphiphilic exporter-1
MTLIRTFFPITVLAAVASLGALGVAAQNSEVNANDKQDARVFSTNRAVIKPEKDEPRVDSLNLTRVGVQTAQPLPLTLGDAIRKALEANNTIEVSRGDVRFQDTVVQSNLGIYDPVFTVSPTLTQNSSTGSTATHDFHVNANSFQFIRPGGGDYNVFFNNSRTESAFNQAQVTSGTVASIGNSPLYSSIWGVTYHQPLFRNFGFDSKRQQLKIAKRRLEQTDVNFRAQVIDTITQVQKGYWDLVFALRDQQNRVAAVNLSRENLRQIESKIEAGASAPLDRAEVATELANRESDLLTATQQVSISENALKQLVIREPLAAEWSQSYVPTDDPTVGLAPVNMDEALTDAMDNRFELKSLKLDKEINDVDIRYFKNQLKPQIDLNTTFSLQGLARGNAITTPTLVPLISRDPTLIAIDPDSFLLNAIDPHGLLMVPNVLIPGTPSFAAGGFNRSLANMFRSDAPNYTIGATISFPFRNRTAKANLAGARIQEEQIAARTRSEEEVVVVEVRNAVQAVETARQQVATARTARENAEIQLAGERKLYESGSSRSSTFLLFQRENDLTNARNLEIRSETNYKKAVADLQRATATTFRENNIDVVSPVAIK